MRHVAEALATAPKAAATHLALSALSAVSSTTSEPKPTVEALTAAAQALLPPGAALPEEWGDAVGEMYVVSFVVSFRFCWRAFSRAL